MSHTGHRGECPVCGAIIHGFYCSYCRPKSKRTAQAILSRLAAVAQTSDADLAQMTDPEREVRRNELELAKAVLS